MSLKEKIFSDFKEAFKNREEEKKSVLSMLLSEIKNKEIVLISRDKGLEDDQVLLLLRKAIKQRKESAEVYRQGARTELAEKEEREAQIIGEYLPKELDDQKIEEIVREAKSKLGAQSVKDLGLMMKEIMPQLKGQADGQRINRIVLKVLNEKE